MPAENLNHLQNNKDLKGMKDMEFEIVKVVNGHEIKRYSGTRKPYFVNIEEENGVGHQEFHSFNTKKEAVKFLEEITAKSETAEETEENTKVAEAEEKFSETYKKNAERMYALKTLMENARDRGYRELERKYRKEYTAIKSEIDMYALQIINHW